VIPIRLVAPATLVLLLLSPVGAGAASTGDVHGFVHDASGAAIAAASVLLESGSDRHAAVTDASGRFELDGIPAQTYEIAAQAKGFAPIGGRLVAVSGGTVTQVDLELAHATTGNVATLGRVMVNGRQALSTASAPSVNLDPQDLAGRGVEQLSSVLAEQIAVTMTRPAGGGAGMPQTASLRGPDPSETLIDIDGHVVNNANTGDFDLELLDPSEFSSIQVIYGVGPASLDGANTQGGSLNFHTIDPTAQDHGLLRASFGSFNTSSFTLQATGTSDQRLGYALSFHRYYTAGPTDGYDVTCGPCQTDYAGTTGVLGSSINATSTLAKLRYSIGSGDGFVEATYRDTAAVRDLSAGLSFPNDPTSFGPGSSFTAFPGAAALTNSPAYGLDVQLPVGVRSSAGVAPAAIIVRHLTNVTDQSAPGVPPGFNPYLLDSRDVVGDDSVDYDRYLDAGTLSFLADVRTEHLHLTPLAPFSNGVTDEAQTQRSFAGRYEWATTSHLHYTAAAYLSRYDTFGTSIDPRVAMVWTPTDGNVVRFSYGTGFRSPLLTEKAINDTLTAEHTSEFELGFEHRFGSGELAPTAEIDAYDTSLRDPIFFVPNPDPQQGQFSSIENLANVVYQGVELRTDVPLSGVTTLHGEYGIDIAYPKNDPFATDPSAPNVVSGVQFQGIPPHKALVSLDGRAGNGFGYAVGAGYESSNNELNRPAYWLLDASIAKQIQNTTIAFGAQNLTNQFADRFLLLNQGPLYPTPTGLVPTNAYSLPGRTLTLTVTHQI
jgi:outer membrane receptor protein involved in Fe transport